MPKNGKGTYRDRIEIVGNLLSSQGNQVGRRNWLKKLNENPGAVTIKLVSEDKVTNELLERVIEIHTEEIKFPWRDVPEQPKCTGDLDRTKGEIVHADDQACPIHITYTHSHRQVPDHTHSASPPHTIYKGEENNG